MICSQTATSPMNMTEHIFMACLCPFRILEYLVSLLFPITWDRQNSTYNSKKNLFCVLQKKLSKWRNVQFILLIQHVPWKVTLNLKTLILQNLTRLFKLLVGLHPWFSDEFQTVLHSLQVFTGTVALGIINTAFAPAVIIPAHKLALGVAANITESCLHKSPP